MRLLWIRCNAYCVFSLVLNVTALKGFGWLRPSYAQVGIIWVLKKVCVGANLRVQFFCLKEVRLLWFRSRSSAASEYPGKGLIKENFQKCIRLRPLSLWRQNLLSQKLNLNMVDGIRFGIIIVIICKN